MYALNLSEDWRVLSACVVLPTGTYDGMPIVDALPDGNLNEYRYLNCEFVHDPRPPTVVVITAPRNVTAGECITVNGTMYKAIFNIPNGEPIITGQNAIETTIEEQLVELTKGE